MKEQRKTRRQSCFVPVEGKKGSIFAKSTTVDISNGGIGFIFNRRVPLNKEIAIGLEFGEEEPPTFVVGRVMWVRPLSNSTNFRIGMTFSEMMRGSKSRLNKFLN